LKDTCKTCDIYQLNIAAGLAYSLLIIQQVAKGTEQHHERTELLGKQIKEDKQKPNTIMICFNPPKTLLTLVLKAKVVYYKIQLFTNN